MTEAWTDPLSTRKLASEGRLVPISTVSLVDRPEPGVHTIRLDGRGEAELLVPTGLGPSDPMPLLIVLHGAGGRADHMMSIVSAAALEHRLLVLAPQSRGRTWDVIMEGYGPDVQTLSEALTWVSRRFPIDRHRVGIGGFSDGASYALSLGITNGDLFRDILAFSPGFAAPAAPHGRPRIFISHGIRDDVLPIERCGRVVAARLTKAGYPVLFREFEDGHIVPRNMVDAAIARFLADAP